LFIPPLYVQRFMQYNVFFWCILVANQEL
jgi:hypothetical protein